MQDKITIAPRYYRWHVDKGVVWAEKNTGYAHLNWEIPIAQTALVLIDVWSHHYLKDTEARSEEIVCNKIVPLLYACRKAEMLIVHAPAPRLAEAHPSWVKLIEKDEVPTDAKNDWPPIAFRSKTGIFKSYARPIELREEELSEIRDCTTGMESFETHENLGQTRGAVLFLEMFGHYSLTSRELIAGLPG